ncbi:hypothetical protein MATR_17480 [Marivirga tractuosa]|uniref:Uncharacterized protein n=1 Tax=Marivirga tractuosa (strain ATCC 23168 / DSM 4126 / NBRC 15989 / NCIMB 1408 / VKM B-1430 / H-43) TaxID=643867 RepID=E4TQR6_MARTH|nr:hypothetical protein [Marivirga tractuosa]ADR20627.1 hypothetical protein Ftrac_0625 [Marivirga tractuosa DSM 4126]BDD14923.1 hypothetical protein MATR_17480 [Marivirga tractuosa]
MKFITTLVLVIIPFLSFSQSIVSYHQSHNGGQVAYAYEINENFRPEIRLYADTFIDDFLVKLMFNYDWIEEENYEFYSGISLLGSTVGGATLGLPLGLNIYPFEYKNFGFLMEFSPSFPIDEANGAYFTGSWGIRYRFNRKE